MNDEMNLNLNLPVINGGLPPPRRYGSRQFMRLNFLMIQRLPNRDRFRQQRLTERSPAPVPFTWHKEHDKHKS